MDNDDGQISTCDNIEFSQSQIAQTQNIPIQQSQKEEQINSQKQKEQIMIQKQYSIKNMSGPDDNFQKPDEPQLQDLSNFEGYQKYLDNLTQTIQVQTNKNQAYIQSQEQLFKSIEQNQLCKKITSHCEVQFEFMQNNQLVDRTFCFKEKEFETKRLKKDQVDIKVDQFLSNLKELDVMGSGAMSVGGVKRYHDNADIHFGGDYAFKWVQFTDYCQRLKAYKELNRMSIVNEIPNGAKYFAQLRCCYIERQAVSVPKIVEYNIVFVMDFGRNSLGFMLDMTKKYQKYQFKQEELLVILRHVLEGGHLLEKHHIAQNDFKPDNVVLNRNYDQVKIIDFGMAILVSQTKDPTLQKKLKWRGGSPGYLSPQYISAYLDNNSSRLNMINKHCLQYQSPRYSPFKSDVYSVAITICEIAGILMGKMIFCFNKRSEIEKKELLESHFKSSQQIATILYNMLLNDEQQRWSFEQALEATKEWSGSTLDSEAFKNYIKSSKLAAKDDEQNKRSQKQNYEHFYDKFVDNMNASSFDDALLYAEKCYQYSEGFQEKVTSLQWKGDCLENLERLQEAESVYLEQLTLVQSSKSQYTDENEFQIQLGLCFKSLGQINFDLRKNGEALKYCEDALIAFKQNNQESQEQNEQQISGVYNTQASIYSSQKNFIEARQKFSLGYEIALKSNNVDGQAAHFTNMCILKIEQRQLDEEALQFIDNSIMLFEQDMNGQNNEEVTYALFVKCRLLSVIESHRQEYEEFLKLALQIAKNRKGGGETNKQYAEYIKYQGMLCSQEANEMKSIPLKKHALLLLNEVKRAFIFVKDTQNIDEIQELIDQAENELKNFYF